MGLFVIVDGGSCHFRIGKEFCKQRVIFGAKVPVVLVKEIATGNANRMATPPTTAATRSRKTTALKRKRGLL